MLEEIRNAYTVFGWDTPKAEETRENQTKLGESKRKFGKNAWCK